MIEEEMIRSKMDVPRSLMREKLEVIMLEQPNYWRPYYNGSPADTRFARKYSVSDRSRYYRPAPEIQSALERLLLNMQAYPIPLSLLSQYLPVQYERIRDQSLENNPDAIIKDKICGVLDDYFSSCQGGL